MVKGATKMRWIVGLVVVGAAAVGFFVVTTDEPEPPRRAAISTEPSGQTAAEPKAITSAVDRRRPAPTRDDRAVPSNPSTDVAPAPTADNDEEARRALNGRLFAAIPFEDADAIIDELGLDRIAGMRQLLAQARVLRGAINSGKRGPIREAAQDYLRAASKLQTVEVQQQYHAILKAYHREHGRPAEEVGDIKDVLIPAFQSAQELARVR